MFLFFLVWQILPIHQRYDIKDMKKIQFLIVLQSGTTILQHWNSHTPGTIVPTAILQFQQSGISSLDMGVYQNPLLSMLVGEHYHKSQLI